SGHGRGLRTLATAAFALTAHGRTGTGAAALAATVAGFRSRIFGRSFLGRGFGRSGGTGLVTATTATGLTGVLGGLFLPFGLVGPGGLFGLLVLAGRALFSRSGLLALFRGGRGRSGHTVLAGGRGHLFGRATGRVLTAQGRPFQPDIAALLAEDAFHGFAQRGTARADLGLAGPHDTKDAALGVLNYLNLQLFAGGIVIAAGLLNGGIQILTLKLFESVHKLSQKGRQRGDPAATTYGLFSVSQDRSRGHGP
ncbi:hypothetical protein DESPIG_02424, partial [Desulfovibrio piger ATCC 29098]